MRQVSLNYRTNTLAVREVPAPRAPQDGVLVRTAYSLISLGTEGMKVTRARRGVVAMARERPDQVRQVIEAARREGLTTTYRKVMNRLDALNPLGYSLAGEVVEVGPRATGYVAGQRVACAGEGIASHAEYVAVPRNLVAPVPDAVSLDQAAFATVGAIAMQGTRQLEPGLAETVVVLGLGLVGQVAVQLLSAAGCRVIGIDLDARKCQLAATLGAVRAVTRDDPDLEAMILAETTGVGADGILITAATSSNDPARLAVRLARERGRIVVLGIVGLNFEFEPVYRKDLEIRMSRSYGPGRYDRRYEEDGVDYPIAYVRWTEQRNMTGFLDLCARRRIQIEPLITHRFPLDQADQAYAVVRERSGSDALGILLEYPRTSAPSRVVTTVAPKVRPAGGVVLGVIGAGNFARTVLLPRFKASSDVHFRAVATATGLSARHTADQFGFETATTDPAAVLDDDAVNLVVIATRHDSHASLVIEALRRRKAVFVEKPLAITVQELEEVARSVAEHDGRVMVGFNRRFARLTAAVAARLRDHPEPLAIAYRVNAGFIPPDHWMQDPQLGGGRIVGEACHFIDWVRYMAASPIVSVSAGAIDDCGRYRGDNVAISLQCADTSVATVHYLANGSNRVAKERVEVFAGGVVAILDDYRELIVADSNTTRRAGSRTQDKGHDAEIQAVITAVREGRAMPIPFDELLNVSAATLAVGEALRRRAIVMVDGGTIL